MVAAITNILKETRSEILSCLKTRGRMCVEELASEIGVSKVSIRRHLDLLGRDGLISFDVERQDRGRPEHVYYLTEKAELVFPTRYSRLALAILKQVQVQLGEQALTCVIGGQATDLIEELKPELEGVDFDAKVKKLYSLINERGYDVSVEKLDDGSYIIKQRNCPIIAVATAYDQVCNEEIRVYKELLETEIFRECRIAAGASSCNYRILPPPTS